MTLLFPLREPESQRERDEAIMELALRQARAAWEAEEVPVGAVVVRGKQIIGRGANGVEALKDATAHAEMLALSQAFAAAGEKRLVDAELYCTLEPCIQCTGALLHARIKRLVYGAADPKFGGVESLARLLELPGLNHRIEAVGGVLAEESAALLREFFRRKRAKQPLADAPEQIPPSSQE
ncbi:MAG: nucleoside deaminase [Planctomycetes bacterium]|nr:nucleoside deaminase [Planctomycetota bacterium]MCP4770280.1 nucleoside deaminase [Planctomycetota bacterium]MCP4861454.1 nucleoside deaminase [Planctomycetota bacterium]